MKTILHSVCTMNWRLQVIIRKATAKLSYYKVLLLFGAAEP